MERLHKKLIACFVLLTVSFLLARPGMAQEYCSLTVRALGPNGRRPMVSVSVEEQNGRVENGEQQSRDVRFCDLGGLPVTVRVGDDGTCNQVVIKNVPISWQEPYLLRVTYDPEPCDRELPPPPKPICRVILRVLDQSGKWVPHADVLVSKPESEQGKPIATDQFGRASFTAPPESPVIGTVKGVGGSSTFSFQCSRNEAVHEERIVLSRP